MTISPKYLAIGGLFLTNLFWAGNAIVARLSNDSVGPFTLNFGRWSLALLILLPFCGKDLWRQRKIICQKWPIILVLGLLAITTYNTFLYLAAHSTTAINITLVGCTLPVMTMVASSFLLASRPTRWQLLGLSIALSGVVVIVSKGNLSVLFSLEDNSGDIMIFGISCCWALYSVLIRKYPLELKATTLLTTLIIAGMPILLMLATLEWLLVPSAGLRIRDFPVYLYLAIFPSILSLLFWGYGVKILGPAIASISSYSMPLFAAILSIILLNESLALYHLFGSVMIFIGLYFGSIFQQLSK